MPTSKLNNDVKNDEENITFSSTALLREEPSTKLDKVWKFFVDGEKPEIATDYKQITEHLHCCFEIADWPWVDNDQEEKYQEVRKKLLNDSEYTFSSQDIAIESILNRKETYEKSSITLRHAFALKDAGGSYYHHSHQPALCESLKTLGYTSFTQDNDNDKDTKLRDFIECKYKGHIYTAMAVNKEGKIINKNILNEGDSLIILDRGDRVFKGNSTSPVFKIENNDQVYKVKEFLKSKQILKSFKDSRRDFNNIRLKRQKSKLKSENPLKLKGASYMKEGICAYGNIKAFIRCRFQIEYPNDGLQKYKEYATYNRIRTFEKDFLKNGIKITGSEQMDMLNKMHKRLKKHQDNKGDYASYDIDNPKYSHHPVTRFVLKTLIDENGPTARSMILLQYIQKNHDAIFNTSKQKHQVLRDLHEFLEQSKENNYSIGKDMNIATMKEQFNMNNKQIFCMYLEGMDEIHDDISLGEIHVRLNRDKKKQQAFVKMIDQHGTWWDKKIKLPCSKALHYAMKALYLKSYNTGNTKPQSQSLMMVQEEAAVKIQRLCRGGLGRKIAAVAREEENTNRSSVNPDSNRTATLQHKELDGLLDSATQKSHERAANEGPTEDFAPSSTTSRSRTKGGG